MPIEMCVNAILGCGELITRNMPNSDTLRRICISSSTGGVIGLITGFIGAGGFYHAGFKLGDLNGMDDNKIDFLSEAHFAYMFFCAGVGVVGVPAITEAGVGLYNVTKSCYNFLRPQPALQEPLLNIQLEP